MNIFVFFFLRMREERKKKAEDASDALSWVARSRKIEEKRNAEKQRAQQLSRIFEEQVFPPFLGHIISFCFSINSFLIIYPMLYLFRTILIKVKMKMAMMAVSFPVQFFHT